MSEYTSTPNYNFNWGNQSQNNLIGVRDVDIIIKQYKINII